MNRWWQNLSVVKKLYAVVGLMAVLIASELFTLFFAMNTLSSVRAFVAGEGIWSKAQKDAIFSVFQYALIGDERYFDDFNRYLEISDGDHVARMELTKPNFDPEVVRKGFLKGGNHPDDVDGMIDLLVRFHSISYIRDAINAWTQADQLIAELRVVAEDIHLMVRTGGKNSLRVADEINRVVAINSELTKVETAFSESLGAGSRWLEALLMTVLALTVLTIESTGIVLTYRFSRTLSRSLKELRDVANAVGQGNFASSAPVRSKDELGDLAEALNRMIGDLHANVAERRDAEKTLRKSEERFRLLNEELEKRVAGRTLELQQRESQLRQVTNALPVLLAQMDRDETILFANDPFCDWFRKSRDEIVGAGLEAVVGPRRYAEICSYVRKAQAGEISAYEHESKSGTRTVSYGVTFIPEFDAKNEVVRFILIANDISRYKEIESELTAAKEAADVANATKSAFLANMSHEIRTPLGAILGFSELMLGREMTPAEEASCVEAIRRNGNQLSTIINDILDLSKVEAGKLEIEQADVPFDEIVKEIGSFLSVRAIEKGIKLAVKSERTIPALIQTDLVRLRQILLNLVSNAIKFTDEGSVEVAIRMIDDGTRSRKLAFFVSDTGRGITSEQAARLFQPFTQADVSTTRKFGGTGLGLVLSKKLAQALGGDVVLEKSSLHEGSTFVASIDPGNALGVQVHHFEAPAPPRSNDPVRFDHLKLLLVEDSVDNQILVSHFLRKTGVQLEIANDGSEGVKKASSGEYDLVLMDLQMPVMDGYEAISALRSKGYSKPIIALTAHAMKEERRWCLENGFDDHLSKPISRDALLHSIEEHTRA